MPLELRDLFCFESPADPANTVLAITVGDVLPDAVYRIAVDNDGDLREDLTFSFVVADGTVSVYLALRAAAEVGDAVGELLVERGALDEPLDAGSFAFFVGTRPDPTFAAVDGARAVPVPADDVLVLAVEVPTSGLAAKPDLRIWAQVIARGPGPQLSVADQRDRVAQPFAEELFIPAADRAAYRAGRPVTDREHWVGAYLAALTGHGHQRDAAVDLITEANLLPDQVTYDPAQPARYPNGRSTHDDVADERLALLTRGAARPSGQTPRADHPQLPYL